MRHTVIGLAILGSVALAVAPAQGDGKAGAGGAKEAGLSIVESAPVTIGETIKLRSEILDSEVTMGIALPESFAIASPDHTYPVIFINGGHGEQFFTALVGIAKHLGSRERIPECIVVSLNDMGPIPKIFTNGMWGREVFEGDEKPEKGLRHLEEEVFPYLEENYRANSYRMVVGVSGSSLFPLYTFTHGPDLFKSHILVAGADMVGMGYRENETFLDQFETLFEADPDRQAKFFVGVADRDLEGKPEYVANLRELETRFDRFEGMDVRTLVVPKSDHYAVFLKAMISALEQNFPDEVWASRYRDLVAQPGEALENIDRYYEKLSQRYGFRILPRANRWNNVNSLRFMTQHLIRLERYKEAVSVAQRRIEYRPRSSAPYAGLASALEADGRLAEAIVAQRKALGWARVSQDQPMTPLEERLQELLRTQKAEKSTTAE